MLPFGFSPFSKGSRRQADKPVDDVLDVNINGITVNGQMVAS
jgi:hypothetical protein